MYRATPSQTSDEPQDTEDEPVKPQRSLKAVPAPAIALAKAPQPEVFEPIRQVSVRQDEDAPIPERAVVKGYEYEKNRYVALEPEELRNLAPKTATEMGIEEFVKLDEVDPVYFETSYYVVPEDAGQKAYSLLYKALQTTGLVAVAQFAMHSRDHVVILRPAKRGLIAHTMFFNSEVRADEEWKADTAKVTPKELQLAETLIHSLAAPFTPEKYRDTYREKLESLIASKVAGQPFPTAETPTRSNAVVDITEALQKSLAALKKPAQTTPTKRLAKAAAHK